MCKSEDYSNNYAKMIIDNMQMTCSVHVIHEYVLHSHNLYCLCPFLVKYISHNSCHRQLLSALSVCFILCNA